MFTQKESEKWTLPHGRSHLHKTQKVEQVIVRRVVSVTIVKYTGKGKGVNTPVKNEEFVRKWKKDFQAS